MENASSSPIELRKKMLGQERYAARNSRAHKGLLALGGNEASGSTSAFRVRPAANAEYTSACHFGNGLEAAANLDYVFGGFHHEAYVANIAPYVNTESCAYRHYNLVANSATFARMSDAPTTIDRHWLRDRLRSRARGAQTRLAEHLGLHPNVMSKIMNGTRALQQDEIPKVLEFFNARIVLGDAEQSDLHQLLRDARRLNSDGLQLLRNQLNGMLQTPSLLQPHENTEQEDEPGAD